MKQTIAYLYKWTELSTNKWYIGARYAVGCYPGDGYLCSSKVVKPMIIENTANWKREILCIGNPIDIVTLEARYLTELDAKHDLMSFNKHNGDGRFSALGKPSPLKGRVGNRKGLKNSPEHRAKISEAKKGKTALNKGAPMSEAQKAKLRESKKANPIKMSAESNRKRSKATKGIPKSAEQNAKNSAAHLGQTRPKVVCRLSDRKEMCLSHFNRYT